MIKTKITTTLMLALLCLQANAQSELTDLLKKMSEALKPTVELGKEQVNQQLNYDEKTPWKVVLNIETQGKKDKITERFEFNLADFNAYQVSRQSKSDFQGVKCATDRDRNYIAHWENNEKEGYENDFLVYFKDATAADEFVKLFKAAIPLAQTAFNATIQLPADMEGLKAYLASHIVTVASEEEKLTQTLSFDKNIADRAVLTTERSGSKDAVTDVFEWCWGDLNPNSIELRTKGDRVTVEVDTRRNIRFITATQNGQPKGYRKDLAIAAATPDDAKMVIKAMEKIIPLGEKALEARVPKVSSLAEGIKLLNDQLATIQGKGERTEQSLSGDANATLKRKEIDEEDKEKNKDIEYTWFMGDLDPGSVDLEIGSNKISIGTKTLKKNKLVAVKTNGEQSNYDDEVEIEFASIEAARLAHAALPQIIKLVPAQDIKAESADWVIAALADMPKKKDEQQTVVLKKGADNCNWVLTVTTASEKKNLEEVYEFELARVDAGAIEFEVSGKSISVEMPAKYKEKVFKYYKDGKQSFVNNISFPIESIEKAKKMEKTLKTMVEGCK
jgi:hypothetical protein